MNQGLNLLGNKALISENVNFSRTERTLKDTPADDYERVWIPNGMALHNEFQGSDEGYCLWLDWSKTSKSFKSEADCHTHWNSFNRNAFTVRGQVTIGTVYHNAEEARCKKKVYKSILTYTTSKYKLYRVYFSKQLGMSVEAIDKLRSKFYKDSKATTEGDK